jgi:transcriptional antiterminator RfaH
MVGLQDCPSVYPPDLFDTSAEELDENMWWALYTRARREKALARELFAGGLSFYLPLVSHTKIYRRNRITRSLPLFPGYLFLYGSDDARVAALSTNHISRVLTVAEPTRLRHDLGHLRYLIESGAPVTLESRLTAGDRVRITSGALAGIEGTVIKRRSETRVIIGVHFLQQGASVVIDDYLLEPLR